MVGPVEEGEGGAWVGDLGEDGGDFFFFFLDLLIEGLFPVGGFEDLGDFASEFEESWGGFCRVLEGFFDVRDEEFGPGHGMN